MARLNYLKKALDKQNVLFDDNSLEKFETYRDLIFEWNEKVNLTSITDKDEFEIRHFVDSVEIADYISEKKFNRIIDVGTGGGFPGIPLAILFPEKSFLLMDSLNKKIKIINEIIQILGLKNVTALHSRAEDLAHKKEYRENFDFCASRAVAKLSVLCEYCLPFVKHNGIFAAYKSENVDEEINEAKNAITLLGSAIKEVSPYQIPDLSNNTTINRKIIYIEKIKKTPNEYPRKARMPEKTPL